MRLHSGILVRREAMDLKESGNQYMPRFGGKKVKGETLKLKYNIKSKQTK